MKVTAAKHIELETLGDDQLWTELKRGDPDVLQVLFFRYYNDLYFYGTKLVSDQNLVVDTIQDLFSSLWEGKKSLSEVQHIKAYLFKIFRNRLLQAPPKKMIQFSLRDMGQLPDKSFIISHEDVIIEEETRLQMSKTISVVLEELTDRQKEILYLKFYSGLSHDEISDALGMNKQSVSNLLNRSISSFRKKMKRFDFVVFLIFLEFVHVH
jgi:RNA polymerase sigma factor (sigma-70 family)